jgi:hypothetical protein
VRSRPIGMRLTRLTPGRRLGFITFLPQGRSAEEPAAAAADDGHRRD